MIDNLPIFDPFSPGWKLWKNLTGGPHTTFCVPLMGDWTATGIEKHVRRHGIETWGLDLRDELVTFNVRKSQEGYTRFVLQQAGLIAPEPKPEPVHPVTLQPLQKLSVSAASWRCEHCGSRMRGGVWTCTQCGASHP